MPYRTDLDAALARIDALERDNRDLAATNDQLRDELRGTRAAPAPARDEDDDDEPARHRGTGSAIGEVAFLGAVVLLSALAHGTHHTTRTGYRPAVPVATPHLDARRLEIDLCINTIGRPPEITGTFFSRTDVAAIEKTEAPCHDKLPQLIAAAALPFALDEPLHQWQDAEDVLANRISLIVAFKNNDPLAERDHPEATQLWAEYQQALARRDSAVGLYRIAVQRSVSR